MTAPATPTSSAPDGASAPVTEPPPTNFIHRLLANARGYIVRLTVYLGSIAALVLAYEKLINPEAKTAPGLTQWMFLFLAGVPLLLAIIESLYQWRAQRIKRLTIKGLEKANYFSLGPRTAKDHDTFHLPDDAHLTVLEWVSAAPKPILHLTGLSGTGKSSLLQAWLIPELRSAGTHRVILLRSFDDPVECLRDDLLELWENPPLKARKPELPIADLIHLVAGYLADKKQRLLIIFDQFEEFFILHPEAARSDTLRDCFACILANPPVGVTFLLSYRKDHAHTLAPLRLPPVSMDPNRNLDVNGYSLRPFTIAEARQFFTASKLQITSPRLDLALTEAASYEETRAHIRPIVLNLLGRIIATLSTDPGSWQRTRGLVRDEVRKWVLSTPLEENICPLLEKLISTSGTVSPRTEQELADAVKLTPAQLQPILNDLSQSNLLRCLTQDETDPARRIWQVSHDFIARLFALIIEGLHKTFWRRARPWLAPAALVLWMAGALLLWPWYQEVWAIRELGILGFKVNTEERSVALTVQEFLGYEYWPQFGGDLRRARPALQVFQPRVADFSNWPYLKDAAGLQGLTQLEHLYLSGCTELRDLSGLRGCLALKMLVLNGCTGLEGAGALQGLAGLSGLRYLFLRDFTKLRSTQGLPPLPALESLDLRNCTGLEGADAFQGLAEWDKLEELNLTGCTGLRSTQDLPPLPSLKVLSLMECTGLVGQIALYGLAGRNKLEELNLYGCTSLRYTQNLPHLPALKKLSLENCTGLVGADAFQGLAGLDKLEELILNGCTSLRNTQNLPHLPALKKLSLENCNGLVGTDALQGLAGRDKLEALHLKGCTGLESLPDMRAMQSLKWLNLDGCTGLKDRAGLHERVPPGCEILGP